MSVSSSSANNNKSNNKDNNKNNSDNSPAYKAIKAGKQEWEKYRAKAFKKANEKNLIDGCIDLRSADLSYMNLGGYDLSRVDFGRKEGKPGASLSGANLANSHLFASKFTETKLGGADLSNANITGAIFKDAIFDENTCLRSVKGNLDTKINNCRLNGADLSNADLSGADLENSDLSEIDLCGAKLRGSNLKGTIWDKVRIDEETCLDLSVFSNDYRVMSDLSENMSFPALNWLKARWIHEYRLFTWSLIGVILCLLLLPFSMEILSLARDYPVTLTSNAFIVVLLHLIKPLTILGMLFSFILMLSGSVIFKIFCPQEVREFSVTKWVYELKNPRPVYISKAVKKPQYALLSIALALSGLGLALLIVL